MQTTKVIMNRFLFLYTSILIFSMSGNICEAISCLSNNCIRLNTDITTTLRGNNYSDEDVISVGKYTAGVLFNAQTAGIPARAEIDALFVYSNRVVFSTDIDFEKNAIVYANEDLLEFDVNTGQLNLFFDGSANGIKPAANLDAVAGSEKGIDAPLYLSFDITVTLPGIGTVSDEDIVILSHGAFNGMIKGSDLGIPAEADIDALYLENSSLYFSLDISADINGHIGSDNDLWKFDIGSTNVTFAGDTGIDSRGDLISMDQPVDSDGDWLTDFEEYSGIDDPASSIPGTAATLSPGGYITSVVLPDTDGDGVSDGNEAIYDTNPTDPNDYPDLSGNMIIIR